MRRLPTFLLDVGVLADRFIVPTVPSFEYPAQRPGAERPLRGAGAPAAAAQFERPRLVARTGRRPTRRPRHPGHRRQRGPPPAHRADHRGARRRRRDRRGHHRRARRPRHHDPAAREHPCRRIHSARPPAPQGRRDDHQRRLRSGSAGGGDGRASDRRGQHRGQAGGRRPRRLVGGGPRPQDGHAQRGDDPWRRAPRPRRRALPAPGPRTGGRLRPTRRDRRDRRARRRGHRRNAESRRAGETADGGSWRA